MEFISHCCKDVVSDLQSTRRNIHDPRRVFQVIERAASAREAVPSRINASPWRMLLLPRLFAPLPTVGCDDSRRVSGYSYGFQICRVQIFPAQQVHRGSGTVDENLSFLCITFGWRWMTPNFRRLEYCSALVQTPFEIAHVLRQIQCCCAGSPLRFLLSTILKFRSRGTVLMRISG